MLRLTNLADVCRSAGLRVIEVDGWQTRGRSGDGGYYLDGRPTHVMIHHTASSWSAEQDVAYLATGHQYAPVSNLYLARDGAVYVIAAGPTNTNGKGGPVAGCPADDMNRHAIGIEAGNNGVGEAWPEVQQNAYVALCAALCTAYGIGVGNVLAHFEWAPDRTIDPAGPSRWAVMTDRYMRWNMDAFRGDVFLAMDNTPPEDTMGLNVTKLRFDGYAEQLVCFRVSRDTMETGGILDDEVVVLKAPTSAQKATIEKQLGHPLTPLS